jgi:hypothetical protein
VLPLFSSIDPGTGGLILVGVVLFVAMLRGR